VGALLARATRDRSSYLRGAEHRAEANEAVEVNLDPWDVPTWRKHRYDKGAGGKLLFTGTPDQKARKFREWLETHEAEARGERSRAGEAKTASMVRTRTRGAAVNVPCKTPYRFRTKAACKPEPPKRGAAWTRSSLLGKPGRHVEVPCEEKYRPRVKELCEPGKTSWGRAWTPPAEEPEHAFAGLL